MDLFLSIPFWQENNAWSLRPAEASGMTTGLNRTSQTLKSSGLIHNTEW